LTILLDAAHLGFSYGARRVVSDVTLSLRAGEIVALIGPNGAGKTTVLKLLAGLLVPDAGRMDVSGSRSRTLAYLAQAEELPSDWSVREVVELGRLPYVGFFRDFSPHDDRIVQDAMQRTCVAAFADRLVGTLSGGERQRVAMARALAQEPRALLLDEPTAHLDLRHQVDLFSMLRAETARGVGVIAVMHDLTLAAQADACVLLAGGRLRAQGRPGDVLRPDLLSAVYETDLALLHAPDGRVVVVPGAAEERAPWSRNRESL
jgi:ABC-type cobalamin/Fe3+-siderophores transport system ATPase subunit